MKEFLSKEGYDPEYGARPLRRVIQRNIEDSLSHALLSGEIPENAEISARMEEKEIKFDIVKIHEKEEESEPALSGASSEN